jgi:hypothetical protein
VTRILAVAGVGLLLLFWLPVILLTPQTLRTTDSTTRAFLIGLCVVAVAIYVWSKLSHATETQKHLVGTCFFVAAVTVSEMMTRVDFWVILLSDAYIIALGMLRLTRFKPYVAPFAISFALVFILLFVVVPAITDPNRWCPSRHLVAGVCQAF